MNLKDVENLAELAKLELSQEEKEGMLADMGGILDYVKQIESIDVADMELEYDIHNIWREDTIETQEFSSDLIMQQFPSSQDGFLKVKKIL